MSAIEKLRDLIFPSKCRCCGKRIDRKDAPLCTECRRSYEADKYKPCPRCKRNQCRCSCRPNAQCAAVFTYLSVFRYAEQAPGGRLILSVKDRRDKPSLQLLAHDMSVSLQRGCILREDACVTYVPRSPSAILKKGTDQALELAGRVADNCLLQCVCTLRHTSKGGEQKKLDAAARKEHADDSYALSDDCPDLSGRQVILVDDICTTGATLSACAQLIAKQGPAQIICLTAGRR